MSTVHDQLSCAHTHRHLCPRSGSCGGISTAPPTWRGAYLPFAQATCSGVHPSCDTSDTQRNISTSRRAYKQQAMHPTLPPQAGPGFHHEMQLPARLRCGRFEWRCEAVCTRPGVATPGKIIVISSKNCSELLAVCTGIVLVANHTSDLITLIHVRAESDERSYDAVVTALAGEIQGRVPSL